MIKKDKTWVSTTNKIYKTKQQNDILIVSH